MCLFFYNKYAASGSSPSTLAFELFLFKNSSNSTPKSKSSNSLSINQQRDREDLYDPYDDEYDPNFHQEDQNYTSTTIDRTELFSHSIADKSLNKKSSNANVDGEEPDAAYLL
jgi:hypothetical protein